MQMKYMKQLGIILAVSFAGEGIHRIVPLPVPASIYGIVLLFLLLESGRLPLSAVKESSAFLLQIMPLLFIPAAVGLMDAWPVLRPVLLPYAVITAATTIAVMAVSGRVTQALLRRGRQEARHE